jgi:hypothetical protein
VAMQKKQNTRRSLADGVHKIYRAGMFVNAGFIVGFDSEKGSVAEAMIDCIEATAIPFCTVGLLYALPNTQLTRRLGREGRLFTADYTTQLADKEGAGDQCTAGINFVTARPRRDILWDYKTVLARVYHPAAYYERVRTVARLLDRPLLDRSAQKDAPTPHPSGALKRKFRLFGIPRRDLQLLWRLLRRIAVRQPAALWPFCKVFCECVRNNPRAIDYVGILAAFYLHLGPFSRFVIAAIDRQIAEIDSGDWQAPLVTVVEHAPQAAVPETQPA